MLDSISSRRFADVLVVGVAGRLDHDTSKAFGERVDALAQAMAPGTGAMVLDLANVDYISSSGLNALVMLFRQAKTRGQRVHVAALQPMVAEMFEISHLSLMTHVFPTTREAVAAVSSEAAAAFMVADTAPPK